LPREKRSPDIEPGKREVHFGKYRLRDILDIPAAADIVVDDGVKRRLILESQFFKGVRVARLTAAQKVRIFGGILFL
jgi:hypothetical protein